MTFAETMVARMDELGMRAVDLAEKSGVTAQYLSKLMVGRVKEPTWSKARIPRPATHVRDDRRPKPRPQDGPKHHGTQQH